MLGFSAEKAFRNAWVAYGMSEDISATVRVTFCAEARLAPSTRKIARNSTMVFLNLTPPLYGLLHDSENEEPALYLLSLQDSADLTSPFA